ncbi:MAG: nuclear transport factor 2 family protein [Acidobacteria bacterium]|nr:nuclear transport factor 2 family protein [Acidobacteriota bacterium]
MRSVTTSFIAAISIAIFMSACGGSTDTPATNNNANGANTVNSNTPPSNSPVAATTPTPEATRNNAPTLTPVFKAYCAAMEKKDEKALRTIYSSDTIKFAESEAKKDEITLLEYFSVGPVDTKLCEVSNEEITGDTAVAIIRTASMPNGIKIIFVKEGGEWKLTTRSPNIDAMTSKPATTEKK